MYTSLIIPYALGISNNHTIMNSIGIKEDGVPGIDVQSYPMDVVINSKTDKIYVINYYSNTVSIMDGKTNTVLANTTVSPFPQNVVVSYVTN